MATIAKAKAPTQKDKFNSIIAILEDVGGHDDLVQFCNERIEKLNAKAKSANSKKSAEDEKFFDAIADVLADGSAKRATEILNALAPKFEGLTIQKVTSMLTKMVAANLATKTVEKKISTFSLVFGEKDED